jgi:hypothetical protein
MFSVFLVVGLIGFQSTTVPSQPGPTWHPDRPAISESEASGGIPGFPPLVPQGLTKRHTEHELSANQRHDAITSVARADISATADGKRLSKAIGLEEVAGVVAFEAEIDGLRLENLGRDG